MHEESCKGIDNSGSCSVVQLRIEDGQYLASNLVADYNYYRLKWYKGENSTCLEASTNGTVWINFGCVDNPKNYLRVNGYHTDLASIKHDRQYLNTKSIGKPEIQTKTAYESNEELEKWVRREGYIYHIFDKEYLSRKNKTAEEMLVTMQSGGWNGQISSDGSLYCRKKLWEY